MWKLTRAPSITSSVSLTQVEESCHVLGRYGRWQRTVQQSQGVDYPVADPRAARVQRGVTRGKRAKASLNVPDVQSAKQLQAVLLICRVKLCKFAEEGLHLCLELLLRQDRLWSDCHVNKGFKSGRERCCKLASRIVSAEPSSQAS